MLREAGFVEKLYMDHVAYNGTICMKPGARATSDRELRPLELADFYGVLILYATGETMGHSIFVEHE